MYAIIESGNKQYKVEKGSVIDVELLDVEKNGSIKIDNILLVADGDEVKIGDPYVKGAKIVAVVVEDEIKDDKVVSFKYKNKTNYHRTIGHRQKYTRLKVESISI